MPHDFVDRRQYLHARQTLLRLLELGCVPIINENDAIASHEIRYGDNDRIAALVAHNVNADLLVLLTDTPGLYTADPRTDPTAELISEVLADDPLLTRRRRRTRARPGAAAAWRRSWPRRGWRRGPGRAPSSPTPTEPNVLVDAARGRAASAPRSSRASASWRRASCGSGSPARSRASSASTTARAGRWSSAARRCCRPASPRRRHFDEGESSRCATRPTRSSPGAWC